MTLTIDGFIITGTPEDIHTFIKLYKCKHDMVTNSPQIMPIIYQATPDYQDLNKWTITCQVADSSTITEAR